MSNQSINQVGLVDTQTTITTVGLINYEKKKLLGHGGFGQVYLGEYNGTNVAVKRVLVTSAESYLNEEEALKKLDHPNVIKLLYSDSDRNQDFRFYALELCACSMDQLFLPDKDPKKYKGPPLFPALKEVLVQIFRGLNYIHTVARLVHRDVKPENVLISLPDQSSAMPVIKWADFGLSKALQGSKMSYTPSGIYRGTYYWMAPEIYKAGRGQDQNYRGTIMSDNFSAACVAFYFLTKGSHPFGPLVDEVIPNNVMANNPIYLDKLEFEHFARDIIVKMLAHLPEERITLKEAIRDLESKIPTADDQIDKDIRGIENRCARILPTTAEDLANRIYDQMDCDHPEYYWMVVVFPAEKDSVVVYSERNPQQSFIHYDTCGGKYNVMVFRTKQLPKNIPDKDSSSFITTIKEVFNGAQQRHSTAAGVLDEAKRIYREIHDYHQIIVKTDQSSIYWVAKGFSFFKDTIGSFYIFLIELP